MKIFDFSDKIVYSIGLMSGTSLDGIDVCLVRHNLGHHEYVTFRSYNYSDELKAKILECSKLETSNVKAICMLNKELGLAYVDAINEFLSETNTSLDDIAFISNHGQTIWHNPEPYNGFWNSTLQIGDASTIAYNFNKPVVYDFRSLDMASMGQGAPLVPIADYIMFKEYAPVVLLNIGGISNITYIKEDAKSSDVIAFDTGPGNMLIDTAMQILYNKPFDDAGSTAMTGSVSDDLINYMALDMYYKYGYPKSTGREHYTYKYTQDIINKGKELNLSNEDIIASITYFTGYIVRYQLHKFFPEFKGTIIVSGGGTYNKAIMNSLSKDIYNVEISDKYNLPSDAKEAFAFAILGYLRLTGEASNVPLVTGAKKSLSLGSIVLPPIVNEEK